MKDYFSIHEQISKDNRSGASTILTNILDLFEGMLSFDTTPSMVGDVIQFAHRFIDAHPSMAQVINCCRDMIEEEVDPQIQAAMVRRWKHIVAFETKKTVEKTVQVVKEHFRIMTFSHSLLVSDAITSLNRRVEVIASESRPANEGVALAHRLQEKNIDVTLCVDAALPAMVDQCDCVMIGCDCATSRFAVNKIGSYPLALAAARSKVPVYLLCPSSKFLARDRAYLYQVIDHDEEELSLPVPAGVSLINRYFENIPWDLITKVVFEDGVEKPENFVKRFGESLTV